MLKLFLYTLSDEVLEDGNPEIVSWISAEPILTTNPEWKLTSPRTCNPSLSVLR